MRDAARMVVDFVGGRKREDIDTDMQLRMAILRALEVLGEASKRVSDGYRSAHPELPWSEMARTRDRLIHGYDDIDHGILWDIATCDVPNTLAQLEQLVPDEGTGE